MLDGEIEDMDAFFERLLARMVELGQQEAAKKEAADSADE